MLSLDSLRRRATFIRAVRRFFHAQDFLETDTPALLPCVAPEAYIEPVQAGKHFLQTSPELCMKRLLAAGCDRIFQLCRCFRNRERGSRHLPEFLMLEWYRSGAEYTTLMKDCEDLISSLARHCADFPGVVANGTALVGKNGPISLDSPWERLTVAEAFAQNSDVSLAESLAAGTFEEILCQDVEPCLGRIRPTLLYEYPSELGALARLKTSDPTVAERFELYINGLEIANGFSELADPGEQRVRFAKERRLIEEQGRNPGPMPELFLKDLEKMKESAGIALGVDRLLMLFLDVTEIDQAVPFVPEEL